MPPNLIVNELQVKTKYIDQAIYHCLGALIALSTLSFYFGTVIAQNDPLESRAKKNALGIAPARPIGFAGGLDFNSIDDLPDGLKVIAEKKRAEIASNGFTIAPDSEVTNIRNFPKMARPLSSVEGNLKFKLGSLNTAIFNHLKFEGIFPEGPNRSGPWTSVSRIYSLPNGDIIRLHDWDYVANGGGITMQREMLNETVNGRYPAIFSTKKSAQGNALSTLTWATDRKVYKLSMTGDAKGNGMHKRLMDLADSVQN